MTRARTATVLAVLAFVAVTAAEARAAPLAARLERALTVPGIAWRSTGALALELESGALVFGRNAGLALRPASNEKLVVALAALDRFGPHSRVPTRVYGEGRADGAVWRGRLVLKGYGDPALGRDDLAVLARELEEAGVRRVTGGIVADETYFDARRTAPGWRASFYKLECAPLSALVVDEARVGGRMVDDPALAAARLFRAALFSEGIRVGRGLVRRRTEPGATQLADVGSPPLAALVRRMNRDSDNFVAEMLLKGLGARERARGTTAAGARVARAELAERGVPLAGVRIADGSGLSLRDRLTARAVVGLLRSAWHDPRVRAAFYRSLPVAGTSGTLEDRMESGPAFRRVRAKTGTTRSASALSGYVGRRYVFSILQNGNPISFWSARRGQDRFAQILAGA